MNGVSLLRTKLTCVIIIQKKGVNIMKEFIYDLKENKLSKLYIILFSLINVIYVLLAGAKSNYIDKNSLGTTIERHHFEYLSRISRITSLLETLILLILFSYLIKIIIKKDKDNIRCFLIIHFILFTGLFAMNFLVSIISPSYFWTSGQLLFMPVQISIIIFIYFILSSLYKRLFRSSKASKQ